MFWKILLISLFIILMIYLFQQNYIHKKNYYKFLTSNYNQALKNKKLIFISDTHFREKSSITFIDRILIDIESEKPDLIVFAGDIVEDLKSNHTLEHIKDFFLQLGKIAPTYLVYGNHDIATNRLEDIKSSLKLAGVKLLNNEAEWISFENSSRGFWLMGLSDRLEELKKIKDPLEVIDIPETSQEDFKILLTHYPELFKKYLKNSKKRPDLILSGHTHGGQIILPIIGGLFVDKEERLTKYDFGIFTSDNHARSRMIVTKGIGNASFSVRLNNRPEIVVIEFE